MREAFSPPFFILNAFCAEKTAKTEIKSPVGRRIYAQPLDVGGGRYYFVDYEEGIYVGYRYYETRGYLEEQAGNAGWYDEHVVYPFGYDLGYAEFERSVTDASGIENRDISADPIGQKYSIEVTVRNVSEFAGREVVQLYGHAPWDEWTDLEKSHTVLLDFAKTEIIQPGDEATVTLEFDPYYLASFDFDNGNYDEETGYVLEALPGIQDSYGLLIGRNAHDTEAVVPFDVGSPIYYNVDPVTKNAVDVRFYGNENAYLDSDLGLASEMTRIDFEGSFPTTPTEEDRTVVPGMIQAIQDVSTNAPAPDTSDNGTFGAEGEVVSATSLRRKTAATRLPSTTMSASANSSISAQRKSCSRWSTMARSRRTEYCLSANRRPTTPMAPQDSSTSCSWTALTTILATTLRR